MPYYMERLLPESWFTNMLVMPAPEEADGLGTEELGLRFDTWSVHLLVETAGEGVEMFTCDYVDLDERLRDLGHVLGELTLRDLVVGLCEKVYDGPDDSRDGATLADVAEDQGENVVRLELAGVAPC